MVDITIYSASNNLVAVKVGDFHAVYTLRDQCSRLLLTDLGGDSLDVVLRFDGDDGSLDWTISVEAVNSYPSWPIRFHERTGYPGSPAVTITVPEGTTVLDYN